MIRSVACAALVLAACGGRGGISMSDADRAAGGSGGENPGAGGAGGFLGIPMPMGPARDGGAAGPDAPWPPPPPPPGAERPSVEPPLPRPSDGGSEDAPPVAARDGAPDAAASLPLVLPGGPCTDSAQCAALTPGAAVCVPPSIGFAGGYCAAQGCSVTAQNCPGGAAAQCIPGDDGPVCLSTCEPAAAPPCREGYVCVPIGGAFRPVCLPGCFNDAGCAAGKRCWRPPSAFFGRCYDPQVQIGDPCVAATDCPANGLCLSEADFGWPHGYCVTGGCRTSANCPPWSACTGDPGEPGACAIRCGKDDDCRPGYRCTPAGRGGEMICIPRCTTGAQCRNMTCHIGTGLC